MLPWLKIILVEIRYRMAILALKLGVHHKFVRGFSMEKSDEQNSLTYMFRLQMQNFSWPKKSSEIFENHHTLLVSILDSLLI